VAPDSAYAVLGLSLSARLTRQASGSPAWLHAAGPSHPPGGGGAVECKQFVNITRTPLTNAPPTYNIVPMTLIAAHQMLAPDARARRSTEGSTMSDSITPAALADELGINPKRLRAFLRTAAPRPVEAKNTTWGITPDVADLARAKFADKAPAPAPIPLAAQAVCWALAKGASLPTAP
jgi:hypothetical protein